MTATRPVDEQSMGLAEWGTLGGLGVLWGGSFLFMAIGLDSFGPSLVTLLRVGFGAVTVLCFPAARHIVPREAWPRVFALAVTWMAFPLSMFPLAQQWINSSIAGTLNSGMPLMTVLISWQLFGVATGKRRLAGVLIGFIGILLIGVPEASTAGTNALGVALVLAAVASYGIAVNLAGPLQREYGALPVTAGALVIATVLCAPLGLADVPSSSFSWGSLAACVAVGFGGTGIAFAAAAALTGKIGPVRMSIVTYIVPLVAVALGVIFRDEPLTAWTAIGTAVVLAGAFIAGRSD